MKTILEIIFTIIISIFSVCGYSQCFYPRLDKGKDLYNQGRYEESKNIFIKAKSCADKPDNSEIICNNWIKKCDVKIKENNSQKQNIAISSYKYLLSWRQVYPKIEEWQIFKSNYEEEYLDKIASVRNLKNNNYEYKDALKNIGVVQNIKFLYKIEKENNNPSFLYQKPNELDSIEQSKKIKISKVSCSLYGKPEENNSSILADFSYSFKYEENKTEEYTSNYFKVPCDGKAKDYFNRQKKDSVLCIVRWYENDEQKGALTNETILKKYNNCKTNIDLAEKKIAEKEYSIADSLLNKIDCSSFDGERNKLKNNLNEVIQAQVDSAKFCEVKIENYDFILATIDLCNINNQLFSEEIGKLYEKKGQIKQLKISDCSNKLNGVKKKNGYKNGLETLKKIEEECPLECQEAINKKRTELIDDMMKFINSVDTTKDEKIQEAISYCELGITYNLGKIFEENKNRLGGCLQKKFKDSLGTKEKEIIQ